ncbi:hypothetical protein [Streptomyces sp. NPDC051214]|uniref:hypothetical protein n=1 Tax=Streptomyces sp. NPDC051214 TaxID=3155282 RepID=UPI003440F123
MTTLPRAAASILLTSLALVASAATASAHPGIPASGTQQPADDHDGAESDGLHVVHNEANVAAFGDMVLD